MGSARYAMSRLIRDDSGQVLPIVALMLILLLGMAGLAVDVGRLYYSSRELQASCDAAALAGSQSLPATTATAVALSYSSVPGNKNAYANMPNVSMVSGYPKIRCLTTLTGQGIACIAPANGNAISVKQQAVIPMTFMKLFGKASMTIVASSTASMRGSTPTLYNVAMVLDTTGSMNSYDYDSNCSSTRLSCALSGTQVLLKSLSPCGASNSTCGTVINGNVANPVDKVAMFAFPNVSMSTVGMDYDCSSSNPTSLPYTFPSASGTTYAPSGNASTTGTYQVIPYSSDYRSSSTSTSLVGSSNLVLAAAGKSGCTGLQAPGGQGTYYAGVIYAAQASLVAAKAANPGSQNVMIILSDGDSTANSSQMGAGASATSGVYPSLKNQCHQAITAAQAATAAGTRVYTVAYGATSSGCTTDSPSISPCQTMQQMASTSSTFFSDYTATGGSSGCISASQPTTNLNQIFTQIAGDLTVARLIPDNTP